MRALFTLLLIGACSVHSLAAQNPAEVRLGLVFSSVDRPGLVVLPVQAPRDLQEVADSVEVILRRDLDLAGHFEVRPAHRSKPLGHRSETETWRTQQVDWVVDASLVAARGGLQARLVLRDAVFGSVKAEHTLELPGLRTGGFRMSVHRLSDEVVFASAGLPGVAATRIVYVRKTPAGKNIWMVDSDGFADRPVTQGERLALSPAWSPDGYRVAYTSYRSGGSGIYEREMRSGQDRLISEGDGIRITPAYSPDGRTLVYGATHQGSTELFMRSSDGSGTERRLTLSSRAETLSPAFSPDGRHLLFVSDRLGEPHLYLMPATGGEAKLLTPYRYGSRGYNTAPDWDPLGKRITYATRVGGISQIAEVELPRSTPRLLTDGSASEDPSWAPDGRHLVYSSPSRDGGGLFVLDRVTGRTRKLVSGAVGLPDWSGPIR